MSADLHSQVNSVHLKVKPFSSLKRAESLSRARSVFIRGGIHERQAIIQVSASVITAEKPLKEAGIFKPMHEIVPRQSSLPL